MNFISTKGVFLFAFLSILFLSCNNNNTKLPITQKEQENYVKNNYDKQEVMVTMRDRQKTKVKPIPY